MKKAQAAVEYLMMIAVALIVALLTIKAVLRTANYASARIRDTSQKIAETMNEMIKS
ncbi:class III signal peptide-containing protein [Thermococcus thermotolerans]|uniref:class III signal peptide-containing protein n=1 Tax=Thermococcus thermotolerans TaxID=2969672 RepID=UPI002157E738|nr:class III signal peptide-containing protein [Thermococcus thermotolerans]